MPGISSQNLFHGGLSVECERCSHGSYLMLLNLADLKERCRGIYVALQNRFLDPPGDCGWYNVSFMPWFERHKEEAWTFLGRILVPILGTGVSLQLCHISTDGQVLELCMKARISGPCPILASMIWKTGPLYSGMFKGMDFAPTFAGSKRDEENCLPCM